MIDPVETTLPLRLRRPAETGMSLIEVMIATGLLLIIALGVLPLITHSMGNNVRGWEATEAANYAKDQLEGFSQTSFTNPTLDIAGGVTEVWNELQWTDGDSAIVGDANEGWWTPAAITGKGTMSWSRRTRLRQFQVTDMSTPLPGTTATDFVHLKEEMVVLRGSRQAGPLGAGQTLSVRMLKAF